MTKNERIRDSILATKERRLGQACRVFELKVDKSHLNNLQVESLGRLFLEAKWLYNHILSLGKELFAFDTKVDVVQVKLKDGTFEDRKLTTISSQIKQAVKQQIVDAINALSAKKKKSGTKGIGKLKFKSEINCVGLKQFGNTYRLSGKNRIRVQGIKKPIKVLGLGQITSEYEIANAKLIKKHGDYFFKITCFIDKKIANANKKVPQKGSAVGIDFGVGTDMTLSNGEKISVKVKPSKRIISSHKELSRKNKTSKNKFKAKEKLEKAYAKQNNIKKEKKIKTVKYLTDNFETIVVQDENIHAWHSGWFGKQIQQSAIGGIISELKKSPYTLVVGRFEPTTKKCRECGKLNDVLLNERIYSCSCGYSLDRDTHSALNILEMGLEQINIKIPTERRKSKPVERKSSGGRDLITNVKSSLGNRKLHSFSVR